jgi:hypothetical protein
LEARSIFKFSQRANSIFIKQAYVKSVRCVLLAELRCNQLQSEAYVNDNTGVSTKPTGCC